MNEKGVVINERIVEISADEKSLVYVSPIYEIKTMFKD